MEKLLIIIVLLVILGILPILRTNFLVISYLQKYFFNIRMFWFFLKSKEGLFVFLGTHIVIYVFIFLLYALSFYFLNNKFFFHISGLLIFSLLIDNVLIIYNLYKSRLSIPKTSYRSISLTFVSILIQTSIFLIGYFSHHFFVAAFILLVCPYIIIAFVHLFLIPFFYGWKFILKKRAEKMLIKHDDIIKIGLLGNYGKSSTSHLLSTIFSEHKPLKGSSQYHHFTGLLQVLSRLKTDTKYFFAELGIHGKGDTMKFCKLLGSHALFLTGLDLQYLANFSNEDLLLQEYLSFKQHVSDETTIYIHNEMFKILPDNFFDSIKNKYIIYGNNEHNENNNKIYAKCFLENDTQGNTHVFEYNGAIFVNNTDNNNNNIFRFKSNVDSKYNLSNLAGALAFYVDQGLELKNIKKILEQIEANQDLFKDYQTLSGLKILECPQDKTIRGLRSGLEYIQNFTNPHFLILDKIVGLRGRKNKIKIHSDVGKKLANYNLEKIFLVNKYYSKFIKRGLISGGFDEDKIFYHGDLGVLRHLTIGTIFVKGEDSSKIFRRIVLRQ